MSEPAKGQIEGREGTVFYKRRIGEWLRRYIIELVIIALAMTFGIVTTVITSNARKVFREAKDVRYAIKLAGTQYYGGGTSIYDPSKPTGLTNGAAELIAEMSSTNGQVYLYAWDDEQKMPLRFEYRKGAYSVVYIAETEISGDSATRSQMIGNWDVSYSFNVLKYDAE